MWRVAGSNVFLGSRRRDRRRIVSRESIQRCDFLERHGGRRWDGNSQSLNPLLQLDLGTRTKNQWSSGLVRQLQDVRSSASCNRILFGVVTRYPFKDKVPSTKSKISLFKFRTKSTLITSNSNLSILCWWMISKCVEELFILSISVFVNLRSTYLDKFSTNSNFFFEFQHNSTLITFNSPWSF